MKILTLGAATLALLALPLTANAQLFGGFDNNTLLGGAVGAGLGGAIGSNLAGAGVRNEGTAIGAALGGLAGAAYGNSRSNFGGNPYAGTFNPGFNGGNLVGTGIGAGLGGVIGSNLAGSGQRQEGTAIGAVLGGLAGYGIANARANQGYTQSSNQSFNQGYAPSFTPNYGPNYGQNFGHNFGPAYTPSVSQNYGGFAPHMQHTSTRFGGVIDNGVQYMPSGQFVTSGYTQQQHVQAPVIQHRVYVAPQPHIYQAPRAVLPVAPSYQPITNTHSHQSHHGHQHHATQNHSQKTFCYKGSNRRYRADGAEFVGGCGH